MKTYAAHVQTTTDSGLKALPTRKPILRSSAVFPCRVGDGLDTKILYMGYWLLKRGIAEVSVLHTVRDEEGTILFRDLTIVDSVKVFEVTVSEVLEALGHRGPFVGSIELEVFSTRDLVFPYPAFVLNYVSETCNSVVHTCGRIYNDIEDLQENQSIQVPESGFDVLPGHGVEPYFAFVNGATPINDGCVQVELVNDKQERRRVEVALGDVPANATRFVTFLDDDGRAFLGGRRGTAVVHHDLTGFFPRFVVGNLAKEARVASLTHTFYDTTAHTDDAAYWGNGDPERFHDASISFPMLAGPAAYTDFVVYPNQAPAPLSFDAYLYSASGEQLAFHEDVLAIDDGDAVYRTLRVSDLVEGPLADGAVSARIVVKGGGRLPARLKFGLNLGRPAEIDVPSNVCFNAKVADAAFLSKPSTFRWAPLPKGKDTQFFLMNGAFVKNHDRVGRVELSFWRLEDGAALERTVEIPPHGHYRLRVSEDDELMRFLNGRSGWVTAKADSPFVESWYFTDEGAGVVGGDHGF
jgi:hypothetical protein